ncbi:MAG: sortase [Aggregatilineales bacterium]
MRDKRPVDELTIEELERILAIRKREERQRKLDRMRRAGRIVSPVSPGAVQHPPAAAVLQRAQAPVPASAGPAVNGARDAHPRFDDEFEGLQPDPERDRFWKSFVNQALLLVEIAAVLGLLFLGYTLVQSLRALERETAEAQRAAEQQRLAALPTIAPTPQLRLEQVVLPGGHTPPTAPGGAQFNLNEIPPNLLPVVQSQIFQPVLNRPPQTPQTALRLIIPKLNLEQTIVQGTDWEALKQGVGQLLNGVNPGDETGNLVLAAHNDIYGELFRHLDQLQPGDRFQIQTQMRFYTYEVTGWDLYAPTDVHVLDSRGRATATLISCYPYQVNDKRIVVFANRLDL